MNRKTVRIAALVAHSGVIRVETLAQLFDVGTLLAPHKRPRQVRFTDALPRNDMGKIVKSRLPQG